MISPRVKFIAAAAVRDCVRGRQQTETESDGWSRTLAMEK